MPALKKAKALTKNFSLNFGSSTFATKENNQNTANTTTGASPKASANAVSSASAKILQPQAQQQQQQQPQFHCCTREGFLARLRSVLDDPVSFSKVLSWMPDGKSFTIVCPRKFSRDGLVYEIFGIRKMSSFLRRLNQVGFARVRDKTDLTNLDVFRKEGFVKQEPTTTKKSLPEMAERDSGTTLPAVTATKALVPCHRSPTSTLLFEEQKTNNAGGTPPRDSKVLASHPRSSFVPVVPRVSSPEECLAPSPATPTVTSPANNKTSESTTKQPLSSGSSSASAARWVCTTPEPGVSSDPSRHPNVSKLVARVSRASKMPLVPPSMPATSSSPSSLSSNSSDGGDNGPVLLRARSESFEESTSSGAPQAQLPGTPKTDNTKKSKKPVLVVLNEGALKDLQLPDLGYNPREDRSTAASVGTASETARTSPPMIPTESPPPFLTASVATATTRAWTETGTSGPRPPPVGFVAEFVRQIYDRDGRPIRSMPNAPTAVRTPMHVPLSAPMHAALMDARPSKHGDPRATPNNHARPHVPQDRDEMHDFRNARGRPYHSPPRSGRLVNQVPPKQLLPQHEYQHQHPFYHRHYHRNSFYPNRNYYYNHWEYLELCRSAEEEANSVLRAPSMRETLPPMTRNDDGTPHNSSFMMA